MQELKPIKEGKVREIYDNGDTLIMVATDRISCFDVTRNTLRTFYTGQWCSHGASPHTPGPCRGNISPGTPRSAQRRYSRHGRRSPPWWRGEKYLQGYELITGKPLE